MGLLKPNQLSPQNTVIDGTDENRFSWVTNGARQTGYRVYIYNNDTDALLHDSTEITSPNNYYDLTAATLANGLNCKWYVNTIAGSSNQDSEYEFFMTNAEPVALFEEPIFGSFTELVHLYILSGTYFLCSANANYVTYLSDYSTYSVKLESTGSGTPFFRIDSGEFDLTSFSNGIASTTSDEIKLVLYVPDLTNVGSTGVILTFSNGANTYTYTWAKTSLVVGWNYLSIAKSSFTPSGSPDWADITDIEFLYYASASGVIINLQAIDMVHPETADNTTITTQDYNFILSYEQDQDVNLKAYKFILSDSNGVEITDTDWIYDFGLEYEFTGFENNESYQIEAKVTSQNDQEASTGVKTFDVLYINEDALPPISTTVYNDNGYIKVNWSDIQYRNMVSSNTPSYGSGKFGDSALEIASGETVDTGKLTWTGETDYTVTVWIDLGGSLSGNFINIDDTYYFGYNASTERFYYYDGSTYTYSDVIALSGLTGYLFLGFTSDYFILKKDNALETSIDISDATTPTVIDSIKFIGENVVDNLHGQSKSLTNAELLAEDYRYVVSATPVSEDTDSVGATSGYNPNKSIKVSDSTITAYQTSGTTGYLILYTNAGAVGGTESFNSNATVMGSLVQTSTYKGILAYQDDTSSSGKVKLFGTQPLSVVDTQEFTTNDVSEVSITKMDDNYALLAYRDSTDSKSYLVVISHSTTALIVNSLDAISINGGIDATAIRVEAIDDTTAALYYFDVLNKIIKSCIVTISESQISLGTITEVYNTANSSTYMYDVIKIDSTHLIFSFAIANTVYAGITIVNDSTLVNIYSKEVYSLPFTTSVLHMNQISSSYYTLVVNTTNFDLSCQIISLDSSYNIILEDLLLIGNTGASSIDYLSSCNASTDSLFIAYKYGINITRVLVSSFEVSANTTDKEAVWVSNYTRFLANFEDNLSAGNITTTSEGYRLKRLAEDGSLYQTISDFDTDTIYYLDMTARNDITYTYALYSLNASGNEDLGTSTTGILDFYGWFLTDGTNIYKFDLEYNSSNISTNKDMQTYGNYTKYPTIGFGVRNYRTGNLKTMPYSYNSTSLEYSFTLATLDEIREFIDNGLFKYLKNTKGEIFKCVTSNFSYKYMDNIIQQPYEISFDWIEVGIGEVGVN